MKTLTIDQFSNWMEMYGKASRENDPKASAELFAQDARYYETPFDEPMVGREAIYQYWLRGAQRLKDKVSAFEIIAVKDNLGIARWQTEFTVIETAKRFVLDCVFLVTLDDGEKCREFREWWHIQEIEGHQSETKKDT